MKLLKEKIASTSGMFSGGMSIISAHSVCHSICLGLIAVLTLFGIAASGMPLGFLQNYNLLFWNMALFFLFINLVFYIRNRKCMSSKMIVFNSGLIITGTPFFTQYETAYWVIGGILVLTTAILYIKERIKKWSMKI